MKPNKFQTSPFLGIKNITVTLQKGSRLSGWLTAKEKSFMNASINFLSVDNSILHTEGNVLGTIDIPVSEITFENDYIYVPNDT